MKNTKYITQYEYSKMIEKDLAFRNVTISVICYLTGVGLYWMSLL